MVDEEALVMTMAMIPFDSPSRQGAGTETSGPRTRVRDAAAHGCVPWKSGYPPSVFRSGGSYSPEEVAEWASPPAGVAGAHPRHHLVRWPLCPPSVWPSGSVDLREK